MRLTDFDVLTFDCYGTLIDWESGIYNALRPWLDREGISADRDRALAAFAEQESAQQAETPSLLYPDLLAAVHKRLAAHWGAASSDEDAAAFGASVGDWPAFADSADSLRYLKQHYKLMILSNVDRASFARSNEKLGVDFDAIFTAEDIGSYKPDPANFAYLLDRLAEMGIDKSRVLHTAQSLFHDHVPAKRAGLTTAWIDRRGDDADGFGATMPPPADVEVDLRMPSLAAFVERHRADA